MSIFPVRPKVAELVFQLYGKPLHPELFETVASRQFGCREYQGCIRITRTGHVITWQNPLVCLTEIADAQQEIDPAHRLLSYRMCGERSGSWNCGHGISYQMSFQVEKLSPEIFLHVHDEILAEGSKHGMLHNFRPNHRLAVAPLGLVTAEARPDCLLFTTFHTFPEEHTIVKSQSLIEKRNREQGTGDRE